MKKNTPYYMLVCSVQEREGTYNVTLRGVRVTIVAVENQ